MFERGVIVFRERDPADEDGDVEHDDKEKRERRWLDGMANMYAVLRLMMVGVGGKSLTKSKTGGTAVRGKRKKICQYLQRLLHKDEEKEGFVDLPIFPEDVCPDTDAKTWWHSREDFTTEITSNFAGMSLHHMIYNTELNCVRRPGRMDKGVQRRGMEGEHFRMGML